MVYNTDKHAVNEFDRNNSGSIYHFDDSQSQKEDQNNNLQAGVGQGVSVITVRSFQL